MRENLDTTLRALRAQSVGMETPPTAQSAEAQVSGGATAAAGASSPQGAAVDGETAAAPSAGAVGPEA